MKHSILALAVITLLSSAFVHAEDMSVYGLQCSGVEASELKACLKKEAGKIDEANLPNEIILSTEDVGKESLLKLVIGFTQNRTDDYAKKLKEMLPLIQSSVATALIIQYEDEPQLYYYVVDKDGKLEVIFDGLNSVDISEGFPAIYKNEPELFFLKSPNISDTFKEWLEFLKEDDKI